MDSTSEELQHLICQDKIHITPDYAAVKADKGAQNPKHGGCSAFLRCGVSAVMVWSGIRFAPLGNAEPAQLQHRPEIGI